MPDPAQAEAPKQKLTVDIGVATIVAAMITAVGAIFTAILASRHSGSTPVALPTVTVTTTLHPGVVITPHPTVTVTKFVHSAVTVHVPGFAGPWWENPVILGTVAAAMATLGLGWAWYARRSLAMVEAAAAVREKTEMVAKLEAAALVDQAEVVAKLQAAAFADPAAPDSAKAPGQLAEGPAEDPD
jgi:hypothetical protein